MKNAFLVTLESSANTHMNYPVIGRLQVWEVKTNGTIDAVFQKGEYVGGEFIPDGGPVVAKRPVFKHVLA